MDISLEIGMRIRHYRKMNHITQERLAEICGLHPTYIGQIERGEKNATIESIYKIALGLNVSMSKLFENVEEIGNNQQSVPVNIYHQILALPCDKQDEIIAILSGIINLLR